MVKNSNLRRGNTVEQLIELKTTKFAWLFPNWPKIQKIKRDIGKNKRKSLRFKFHEYFSRLFLLS